MVQLVVFSVVPAFISPLSTHSFVTICVLLFVCVEVLRPSQPNGVMSSAVRLPNYMFTGQA